METKRSHDDLDSSTRYIKEAAEKRGIIFEALLFYEDEVMHEIYQLTLGDKCHRLDITSPDLTSAIANTIADNKYLTHQLLDKIAVPNLAYGMFSSASEALAYFKKNNKPVVIKPVRGGGGDGICINIIDEAEFLDAFNYALNFCPYLLVEDYCLGKDNRFLVIDGKVVAASCRDPAFVVGDGKHPLGELIEATNAKRKVGRKGHLSKIKMDKIAHDFLKKQNISLSHTPKKDEKIYIRPNANLNTGGVSENIDISVVHTDNIEMVEYVAKEVGLMVAGIDVLCQDISRPFSESGGVILEVNDRPRIRMHQKPHLGPAINVADKIIDMLFPESC